MKAIVLVLDNIRSVENTGSIFRTAEGLGVSKLYLIGTTPAPKDRFGRKRADFAKVSLGAEEMLEWESRDSIVEAIKELKEQNFQIIALEQTENSQDLKNFQSANNFALIVGNEIDGVSKEALTFADEVIEIKMKGEKESLNVAVATGVALFELSK